MINPDREHNALAALDIFSSVVRNDADDTDRQIDRLTTAIEAHGYFVFLEPIPGQEKLYVETLRGALSKIERTLAFNAQRYGVRGRSKRALDMLHKDLPQPTLGVDVK